MNPTVLITGAAKRIGRAIAMHLADKGWNVIVHYNASARPAELLVSKLEEKYPGQKFGAIQADLTNIEEVSGLIQNVADKWGKPNLLINNASVFDKGSFLETSIELFQDQIDVNFRAPFFLIRDFAKVCKQGVVINFVDTRIMANKSDYTAYSLSKKSLWDLTKIAALELAPSIRVNAIAPGVTLAPEDKDEHYLIELAQNIPMKRPGGINPVIKSIDYILENDYLTGQLLFADGGENLNFPET